MVEECGGDLGAEPSLATSGNTALESDFATTFVCSHLGEATSKAKRRPGNSLLNSCLGGSWDGKTGYKYGNHPCKFGNMVKHPDSGWQREIGQLVDDEPSWWLHGAIPRFWQMM